jgi:CHASE3 domain sensor protein
VKKHILPFYLLGLLLLTTSIISYAQQPGINLEAIAKDKDNNPAKEI